MGGYNGPGTNAIVKQVLGPQAQAVGAAGPNIDEFSLPSLKVHVGDQVQWINGGGHTVTFATHGADIPLIVPDPADTRVTGVLDASGNPFWFNTQPELDFDPRGVVPSGVRNVKGAQVGVEDGTKLVGSGLFTGNGNPPKFVLTFTKAGTYQYQCAIHPNMNGAITVLPRRARCPLARGRPGPREGDLHSAGHGFGHARQLHAAGEHGERRARRGSAVAAELLPELAARAGRHDGDLLGDVRRGGAHLLVRPDRVPRRHHRQPHQADSGRRRAADASVQPAHRVPERHPGLERARRQYTGTNHGNGFFSTGILDANPGATQPSSFAVKFTKAGTYNFQCLIHPFMKGQIVVG